MTNFTPWGKTDETTVRQFEQQLGFSLPADYRAFLLDTNGGSVSNQAFYVNDLKQDVLMDVFYGITNEEEDLTLATWLAEHGDELQEKALIIGADQGGGIILYITAGENQGVYYWDHAHFFPQSSPEEGNTYFLADSFDDFCKLLKPYTLANA
ncbi:MAG: SMI1/KNR4 family protein [Janthinobacterium lividum]